MKKLSLLLIIACFFTAFSFAQESAKKLAKLPAVTVKTLDGKSFNTADIANDGNPIIVSFWATWCKPCVKELTTIADVYEDWVDDTNVKLVAVSIDNTRSSRKVRPLVDGKGWEYEVLLDENQEFKRAMNVNMVPHTFLLNGKGEIVWQHTSFSEGSELELIELVTKLANGESID